MYYKNKIETLKSILGARDILLEPDSITVGDIKYPIIDDVIILSQAGKYSNYVRKRLQKKRGAEQSNNAGHFARDIQYTFGEEWQRYDKILEEHQKEFSRYFDIVDLSALRNLRLCDLGCGNGRWSHYLKEICKEIILVDFSDAIFAARKNLSGTDNCLFFMCDLKELPFKDNFADFLFCIGVLHHLPTPCLDEVRNLKRLAPTLLIYLYYSLDNKPLYFRAFLKIVTFLRLRICKVRNPVLRKVFTLAGTFLLYMPLIFLGKLLKPLKLSRFIPLYETYHDRSIKRIEQDVYDRFFTRIEQRVSRKEILELKDVFSDIIISNNSPYWHFLCRS